MRRGVFISFEGPDGCGKTTQIAKLARYCREKGYDTVVSREPGGTPISEKIRSLILDPENTEMDPRTEALLYAASRAQHVAQLIEPALEQGRIVLCDRFVDSSIAYQGFGRGLGDGVRIINEFAVNSVMPDITIFLDVDAKIGHERNAREGKADRLELEALDFHRRVGEAFREIAASDARFRRVDASGSIEEVFGRIVTVFEAFMAERG